MKLKDLRNHYSINILSLFGYINATLMSLTIHFATSTQHKWHPTIFYIFISSLLISYLFSALTYIYECSNKNFRIKNEKFLSNKLILIIQIIGVLFSLVILYIFIFVISHLLVFLIITHFI